VQPAADMPDETVRNGGRLVIVNLQKTPLDDVAALNIFGKIDDVIERLMVKLDMDIPKWTITRRFLVEFKYHEKQNRYRLELQGIDVDGVSFSIFKQIKLNNKITVKKEPFVFLMMNSIMNSNWS